MTELFEYSYGGGKDAEGYYIPLENANTFINQIVDKYYSDFKNLVVYGTNEYPLFLMRSIRGLLQIPRKTFEDHIKNYKVYEILKNQKVIVPRIQNEILIKQRQKETNLLTKFGLIRAMFISNTPMANAFQEFVYIVLHKLEKDKIVKLEDVKADFEIRVRRAQKDRDLYLQQLNITRDEVRSLRHVREYIAKNDDFADYGTPEYKAYRFLAEKHMHKVHIYIVRDDVVNSKYLTTHKSRPKKKPISEIAAELGLDLSESEDEKYDLDEVIEQYDLTKYDMSFAEINSFDVYSWQGLEFYFYIPGFKSTKVPDPNKYAPAGYIEVYDKKHHDAVREYFNKDKYATTKMKNVYITTLENLKSVVMETMSNLLYEFANLKSL